MDGKIDLLKRLKSKKTILSFLVSIIVLYILATIIDVGKTISIIKSANIFYLILAFIVYYASVPIRGYRWKLLLENVNFKGKLKDITEIWFLAYFVNCLVPAKLGDVYRGYLVRKNYKITISRVLGTVVVERLADIIFLIVMLSISGIMVFGSMIPQNILVSIEYGYAILLIALLSLVFLNRQRERIISFLPAKFETAIREFEHGLSKSIGFKELPALGSLTLIGWISDILRLYFVTLALGLTVPLHLIIFIGLLASLLSSIPLTPSGLGAVEFAVAGVLVFMGYGVNVSASVAILDRLISYVSFLIIGSVVYWRSGLK
ncbi:MAG: flippase-like domain-containing protein [Candidatus Aenigmarchaeota archaeon]|nr:flippase-like domain-containing protein [Candidatus Aenigmarchaeota archaeon]